MFARRRAPYLLGGNLLRSRHPQVSRLVLGARRGGGGCAPSTFHVGHGHSLKPRACASLLLQLFATQVLAHVSRPLYNSTVVFFLYALTTTMETRSRARYQLRVPRDTVPGRESGSGAGRGVSSTRVPGLLAARGRSVMILRWTAILLALPSSPPPGDLSRRDEGANWQQVEVIIE